MRTALASVVGFVVVLGAAPTAAQPAGAAGIVKQLSGTAVVVRSGQERSLAPGQSLSEGDTVRTGADGRIGITLKDGTRLSLGANTEVRLDSFAFAPADGRLRMALKILRGVTEYISGRVAKLAPGAVRIETPTSVIGVRGTRLLIEVGQP